MRGSGVVATNGWYPFQNTDRLKINHEGKLTILIYARPEFYDTKAFKHQNRAAKEKVWTFHIKPLPTVSTCTSIW